MIESKREHPIEEEILTSDSAINEFKKQHQNKL